MIRLSGIATFQWSTEEQVWPFERASDGSTLYCKEINFGVIPVNSRKEPHGIVGFNKNKVHRLYGIAGSGNSQLPATIPLPFCYPDLQTIIDLGVENSTEVIVINGGNPHWYNNNYTAKIYIIYGK